MPDKTIPQSTVQTICSPCMRDAWQRLVMLACFMCMLFASCSSQDRLQATTSWQHPQACEYDIRRVLLLPLRFPDWPETIPHGQITVLLAEALQKTQCFAVTMHDGNEPFYPAASRMPTMSAAALVKLAEEWNVQAVACGRITHYGLWPGLLGLKLDIISTCDGSVVWAVDGVWQDDGLYLASQPLPHHLTSLSSTTFIRKACAAAVARMMRNSVCASF